MIVIIHSVFDCVFFLLCLCHLNIFFNFFFLAEMSFCNLKVFRFIYRNPANDCIVGIWKSVIIDFGGCIKNENERKKSNDLTFTH